MNFSAWSVCYWDEAERVKERLELARREQPPKSSPEEALQKRRLAILYGVYLDCVHTARELDSRAKQRGER